MLVIFFFFLTLRRRRSRSRSRSRSRESRRSDRSEKKQKEKVDIDYLELLGDGDAGKLESRARTLDQRLEGLREHLLPAGGVALKQEARSASVMAEDNTEGSCQLIPIEADLLERGAGRPISRASHLQPAKPFVSFLPGGDMKLVADLQEQKRGNLSWRVNGMMVGDEHRNATLSVDPRPTRSMLEKMQLEASRTRVRQAPVNFVTDANSVELPVSQQKLVAEMFPDSVQMELDEKKAANDLDMVALLNYRADEEEEGEVREPTLAASRDGAGKDGGGGGGEIFL